MDLIEKTQNFNPVQSSLIKNGFALQVLAQKYYNQLTDARLTAEKRLKRLKAKVVACEGQIADFERELAQLEPMLKSTVESSVNTVLADFDIKPPYKVHLLYKDGIPSGIRIPKENSTQKED